MSRPMQDTPRWQRILGIVLTVLLGAMLIMSASMKLSGSPEVLEGFAAWPAGTHIKIGALELVCTLLFLIPQTAALGAILICSYMGGAVALHVMQGDPTGNILTPALFGVVAWAALWLRDDQLRNHLPLRFLRTHRVA